ncbi:unnamed protein product [Didymodactylos carnosus]|uniref:Potassium channel domain-containing protein n=1 Tax=Didymodactylos carnosus TaxID=1234261 RepID=A0A814MEP2_9BILA|nr:unnamed protein product [Didymodactylos carnosus]CAF1078338.1 unnamed protein product [Didymodactylos carnosus]CAF3748095.1 unnamed protein product [Didymodactylos carnosus]CAF3844565.1 unnamed protein product [Didymodactylos carnosus]
MPEVIRIHRQVCDFQCALGLCGIILMIIDNEIKFSHQKEETTQTNLIIEIFITISTCALLYLLIYYHYLNIKLFRLNNLGLGTIDTALTYERVYLVVCEFVICAIHPIPVPWPISVPKKPANYAPISLILSFPMFLRCYLFVRCLFLRSHLVRNAALQSYGYLNRLQINLHLIGKYYLYKHPEILLTVVASCSLFIFSWCIRACEYSPVTHTHQSYLDSLYFYVITFTTIGYGDLTPSTQCSRLMIVLIGFQGILIPSFIIAVISNKLQFSTTENYFIKFVEQIKLSQELKHESSNIIKRGIKTWMLKTVRPSTSYAKFNKKLLISIKAKNRIKHQQLQISNADDNDTAIAVLLNNRQALEQELQIIKTVLHKIDKKLQERQQFQNA